MRTQTSTTFTKARDAMRDAFERLQEIHDGAEKYRRELNAADGSTVLLLAFDADYQRIQAEWHKTFVEFYRLASEASDEIITNNARRFGAPRHGARTGNRKRFNGLNVLVGDLSSPAKARAYIDTTRSGADHGSGEPEIDLAKLSEDIRARNQAG